jgi:hypothetical protein
MCVAPRWFFLPRGCVRWGTIKPDRTVCGEKCFHEGEGGEEMKESKTEDGGKLTLERKMCIADRSAPEGRRFVWIR